MKKIRSGSGLSLSITLALSFLVIFGCKKAPYNYPAIPLTSYYNPLQVGKYVTYRLDSLNFYYYGILDTITSYLAKDSVEEAFTDNQGRPSWRIVRYLTDTNGIAPWTPSESYMVTPSIKTVEVMETNLRTIKLAFPLDEGFNWTGNTYLPYAPYQDLFNFNDDAHLSLQLWNFTYQHVNASYTLGNKTYDSTVTVLQKNDSLNVDSHNVPIIDTSFASRTLWTETYAKNIGLIYRHTALREYQPPPPRSGQNGYKIGFEVTMKMVDHN